jgi:hypothetical protein
MCGLPVGPVRTTEYGVTQIQDVRRDGEAGTAGGFMNAFCDTACTIDYLTSSSVSVEERLTCRCSVS